MGNERKRSVGVDPEHIVRCTDCERVYTGAITSAEEIHPAGTDGTCACGNDEFEVVSDVDGS